ncbi:MAG: hypothetical protein ABUJ92_10235 [Desulfobacterales bacterium]
MDRTSQKKISNLSEWGPRLRDWPLTAKVLVTMIIVMMSLGLSFAVGQIIVHDIIPTFSDSNKQMMPDEGGEMEKHSDSDMRGDLFSDASEDLFTDVPVEEKASPFYQTDEFIFALKFTHIHIFGMSAIFILMGMIVLFLDLSIKARIWLIVLPFIGIIIDLSSAWLKLFVHPAFFWLHIPGGTLFGAIFAIDAVLMLWQMWGNPPADYSEMKLD